MIRTSPGYETKEGCVFTHNQRKQKREVGITNIWASQLTGHIFSVEKSWT